MPALARHGVRAAALAAALLLGAAPVAFAPEAAAEPTFKTDLEARKATPGILITADADDAFDNAGTNPRYTEAAFSTMEYYVEAYTRIYDGLLFLQPKTSEELNALASPPPDPFTVTVEVTMTNDEGETATGTLKFKTDYASASDDETAPSLTTNPQPYQVRWTAITAEPGTTVTIYAVNLFASAGTNPKITGAVFSTTEYYDTHEVRDGLLRVTEWNFPGAAIPRIRRDVEPADDLDARAEREERIANTSGLRPTKAHVETVYGGEWEAPPKPEQQAGAPPTSEEAAMAALTAFASGRPDDAIGRAAAQLVRDEWEPMMAPVIEPILAAAAGALARGDSLEAFRDSLPEFFAAMDDSRTRRTDPGQCSSRRRPSVFSIPCPDGRTRSLPFGYLPEAVPEEVPLDALPRAFEHAAPGRPDSEHAVLSDQQAVHRHQLPEQPQLLDVTFPQPLAGAQFLLE